MQSGSTLFPVAVSGLVVLINYILVLFVVLGGVFHLTSRHLPTSAQHRAASCISWGHSPHPFLTNGVLLNSISAPVIGLESHVPILLHFCDVRSISISSMNQCMKQH